jgi:diguanylate cyclase (GGDEF)-like protein
MEDPQDINTSSCDPILSPKPNIPVSIALHVAQLNMRRERRPVDFVFEALLASTNQELAKLLRDVRRSPQLGQVRRSDNRQDSELLKRAVQCAAKQYMMQAELGNLALKDELTGLYNRRGFHALAERQLKLGRRSGREMLLFFIDLDRLKEINDSFGHAEGDRAIRRTAEILKKTFRDSDVIARLGGDEFAVLAIEACGHSETTIMARIRKYLSTINTMAPQCRISVSIGVARFDHRNRASIEELLSEADRAMYRQKQRRSDPQIGGPETGSPCL